MSAGFSPAECAAIRGLDRDTLFDHALRAAEAGMAVRAEWFLRVDTLAALEEVIGETAPERIRPLLAQLPKGIRYEEVQFYVRCRTVS